MNMQFSLFIAVFLVSVQSIYGQTFSFSTPNVFDAGYNSNMLLMADFNNDGLDDIATANYGGDNVSILLAVRKDSFAAEVTDTVGDGAWDLACGDFNNDGDIDLVVTNYLDDDISVLLGNGDGTFQTKVDYAVNKFPRGVVVGLFNNDSIPDIAVANYVSISYIIHGRISVFIGNGNGTFASKVDYPTGKKPYDLLMGYIDQDTNLDLISVNRSHDDISVLRGNGNGTFKTEVDFDVGHYPEYATLGDFNNDSLLDIAVCNAWNFDSVSVLLGDTGTIFKAAQNFYAGYRPFEATAADFDKDGNIDLALTIANYDSINILMGNGDGTFQYPFGILAGNTPHGIISVDIEGDSDIDILNVNYQGGGSTYLYYNTFCPDISFTKNDVSILGGSDGSATAIVTGGLRPYTYLWNDSLSQTDSTATGLSPGFYIVTVQDSLDCKVVAEVEINNPVCTMQLSITKENVSTIGGQDGEAIVTPFNGVSPYTYVWDDTQSQTDSIASTLARGDYEVIVTDSIGCKDTTSISVLEIPCISDYRTYTKPGGSDLELCYINNDSILDLVTLYSVAYSTDKVHISFGNGDGTFTYHSSFTVGTGGDQPMNIEVNDFNGDTINDIIVAVPDGVNGFSVYLGNGDSTFQTKTNYYTGSRPWDMVSHDIDNDGDVDLMICRDQAGDFRVYKNNGSGVFSYYTSKSLGSATYPKAIESGYFNNDTLLDIVVAKNTGISVFLGHATYTFLSPTSYIAGLGIRELALGDFNNDSIIDIAASGSTYDEVYVFIGKGDGTFNQKVEYPSGDYPRGIEAYDMNGDNNLDLAVSCMNDSTLFVMLGNGSGTFDSTLMYPLGAKPFTSTIADIDQDGDNDLLVTLSGVDSVTIVSNCFIDKCLFISIDSVQRADRNTYNGLVSVSVIGENPPFFYQWNDSLRQTTSIADSLKAGTYKLIVTDSLACSDSIFVTIEEVPCAIDTHIVNLSICNDDSVYFAGVYVNQTGFYYDSLTNILGCDSVQILDLKVINNTTSSMYVNQCYSYISPSNKSFYTSGVYSDTIANFGGCDSIISINLTIYNSSSSTIFYTVCDSITVPSGDETYSVSGVYSDTIPNYFGCDSFITINLTVNYSNAAILTETVCSTYTVPSGDEIYTTSGVYSDTIPNHLGCDSILTINLTVNHSSSATIFETSCYTYTVPSGDETYTKSGVYSDTIPNYHGCDSLLTINLTVNHSSTATIFETSCYTYTVPSGDETYTKSGVYSDTILNYFGCDSLLTINITVNHSSRATLTEVACYSYIVPSGDEIYTKSGVYSDSIPNYHGCDSLLTINLTINHSSIATLTEVACYTYIVPASPSIVTKT